MKKRLISLFVALTMLLCLIPAAFAATFNAGTYTASANGMNGAVTVEVTFSDSAITDVKVTEQAETPAIASGALEQIPADIVAHQTLAVDTVTGATITSKAILAAVEDCVKQAGADPDTLRTPIEKDTADVGDRTAHVEVLVIGGGGTGLAAAMSAMDSGAKDVMVVEKLSRFGGSTSVSGAVVAAENTYYTQSIGLEPNSEVWLEEWKASSDSDIGVLGKDPGYPTYERVSNYFTQVGETVNWLEDEGVAHWVTYPFFPNGRYQVPDYVIDSETGAADPEGGYMLIDHMVDWLKNHDADLRLSTTGTKLLTNDAGDVIGATVQDANGSYDVYASRGVVLATGGFAASEPMMREYLPQFADWIDLTTAGAGDTGDGMQMVLQRPLCHHPWLDQPQRQHRGLLHVREPVGAHGCQQQGAALLQRGLHALSGDRRAEPHGRRHRVGAGRQQVRGRCAAGRGGGRHRSRQGGHHRRTCRADGRGRGHAGQER